MFFFKTCNVYGSANRTMPDKASGKQVSRHQYMHFRGITASLLDAHSWVCSNVPSWGETFWRLVSQTAAGNQAWLRVKVIRTQGFSGVDLFRTVISETPVKQIITFNIKSVLEICWWYCWQSEICSKNTRKNTRFVKNRDRMESLGKDDVSALNSPKYEMVRDDVKQN